MAKAIIFIDDDDAQAQGKLSVQVTLDPPMPATEEERNNTPVPPSVVVAMHVVDFLNHMMQLETTEVQTSETEEVQ